MPSSPPPPQQPQSLPPASPAPGVLQAHQGGWAGVSSCYDAAIGMQGCSHHTRFHCGAIWGGGGAACLPVLPPCPITTVFISVVIWGHFFPIAVQFKAECEMLLARGVL